MHNWTIYAILAGAAYGLSAVPLKYAVHRNTAASSEFILLSSSLGALSGIILYLIFFAKSSDMFNSFNKETLLLSLLSGLIGVLGSLAVIKAFAHPLSKISGVMALVNTNVFFSFLFGVFILRDIPSGIESARIIAGSTLIFAGTVLICK